jgi:membrane-bound ClpP family serine protease
MDFGAQSEGSWHGVLPPRRRGIGGISQEDCRVFLTNAPFRAVQGAESPVVVRLHTSSKQEVDDLFERWKKTGVKIIEAVEDKAGTCVSAGSRIWMAIVACVLRL